MGEFKNRFGIIDQSIMNQFKNQKTIWIHAASVGETMVGGQLVEKIRTDYPDYAILFSTITRTGYNLAEENIEGIDGIIYLPFDIPIIINRILRKIKPQLLILVETEIWPNLIRKTRKSGSRIMISSGRIGDKSFNRYQRLRPLVKKVLSDIDSFYMQTEQDAERIIELGALKERVKISGNIKYDRVYESIVSKDVVYDKLNIDEETPVFVAGSTHDNEEEQLLTVYKRIKESFPDLIMIIAPRYVERAEDIQNLCLRNGLSSVKWTELNNDSGEKNSKCDNFSDSPEVIIVDTFGELAGLYQLATLVFVGGSLIAWGGHNILEPAAYGKAVFVGPHMFNFREDVQYFDEGNALVQVTDSEELADKMKYYLDNKDLLHKMGEEARKLIVKNQGALQRNIEGMDYLLIRRPRILLVRLSAIGDVIHALPAAHAVRQKYPLAEINWLVEDRVSGLVGLNPYIDNIIVMPRKKWQDKFCRSKWQGITETVSFLKDLKKYNFDMVLDMHGIFKSALPAGITGAPKRFGSSSAREGSTLFYNQKVKISTSLTHKIDRNLCLVEKALGADINTIEFGINPGDLEKEKIENLLKEHSISSKSFVVINPFTTWETKNWPLERYVDLSNRVEKELDYEVIFTGGPGEKDKIGISLKNLSSKIYNFAGRTNLRELAELYKRAKLYIGGDTGPMHLAVAVSLPVVAIMGPTDPEIFGPYGDQNIVIQDNNLECMNCHKRECNKDLQCMKNISVEQVFTVVKNKLLPVKGIR